MVPGEVVGVWRRYGVCSENVLAWWMQGRLFEVKLDEPQLWLSHMRVDDWSLIAAVAMRD